MLVPILVYCEGELDLLPDMTATESTGVRSRRMSRSAKPSAPPAPSAILVAPLNPAANLPEAAAQLASADNPSAVLGCVKPSRNGVSAPLTVERLAPAKRKGPAGIAGPSLQVKYPAGGGRASTL